MNKLVVSLQLRFSSTPHLLKSFSVFGLGFGLSEGGSLPSGVGGVSSKAAAPIFVPSIAVPSRPPRSFWIYQIYRSSVPLSLSLSLSLSRPHLANDEAHALSHGYACSESTSAPLRPKLRRFEHVSLWVFCKSKIGKLKAPRTLILLFLYYFEPCLVNTAMFSVAGPWSYFPASSL